jgi:hypothetical protein
MDDTIGAAAQRRAQRRKQLAIGLLVFLAVGVMVSFMINTDPTQSKGAMEIVRGTGAKLETVFVGPTELRVKWERMIGQAWSVSLAEGRIRNISDKTVKFQGIIYYVKDENGDVIWEEADERYIGGGMIEPLGSISFACHPICKREARIFELLVKDTEVLRK